MAIDPRVDQAQKALRLTFGLVPFLAGLDKFFGLLADWPGYLSPAAAALLPVSPQTFMHVVGVIEMAVGIAILTRWTTIGAYAAAAWLVLIAVNLVASGRFFDVAVRDVVMAIAAWTLGRLTEAVRAVPAGVGVAIDAQERARVGRVA